MMKKILFIVICVLFVSCRTKTSNSSDSAQKALNEGFVFVDGTGKIIHWDESCNRAVHKIMVLKDIKNLHRDIEFCSCVPVPIMKEIKEKL